MQAARFHRYGDASVLQIEDIALPQPQANEVRVRVVSSSLNAADIGGRQGITRLIHARSLPHIPGYDLAGVVDACGESVTAFLPGESVYALTGLHAGAHAEYVCLPQDRLAATPKNVPLHEAGAIPLAGLTALQALRGKAHIQSGHRLLVNGATGGVGMFAVQLGKALGCHVTAVCRGEKSHLAREYGADAVIDYGREDFATLAQTWNVVFDAAGNRRLRDVQAVLAPDGVLVGSRPNPQDLVANRLPLTGNRPRYTFLITQHNPSDLALLARLFEQEKLRVPISKAFALNELQDAHRFFESGDAWGKVVVRMP